MKVDSRLCSVDVTAACSHQTPISACYLPLAELSWLRSSNEISWRRRRWYKDSLRAGDAAAAAAAAVVLSVDDSQNACARCYRL